MREAKRTRWRGALLTVAALPAVAIIGPAPNAAADNNRLNNGVVSNVYTIQHRAGCMNDVTIDPRLRLAAERHTDDVLANRNLEGDIGTDGSMPRDRAAAAGFRGTVAETVATVPALAINGLQVMQIWFDNPAYLAIMRDCSYTKMGVWSANSLDRSVLVAMYGHPD